MSEVRPAEHYFGGRFLKRIQLQFLGAGNWKKALVDSNLPEEVTSVIGDVVQRTGLLRFEKSEITTELIHHFQDGHERGQSFEDLVRDFGKSDVAVSLFRSSKLRSRPMSVKAFRGSAMVFGGGLIGYLILQMFFHSAKPNPTVDYSAKLNEAVTSMPIEQQAWPMYREVWAKHGLVEGGKMFEEIWIDENNPVEHQSKSIRLIRPDDEGWDKAVTKLQSLKELLDVLREGSTRPYLGTPLHLDKRKYSDADLAALFPKQTREEIENNDESTFESFGLVMEPVSPEVDKLLSGTTFGILLPHIQQFRRAARVLRVDTRYAMEQGDNQRAIENVETIFGLGSQAGNSPIAVCSLVGRAVHRIGFEVIEELTNERSESFSDEELRDLQSLAVNVKLSDAIDVGYEKDFVMDLIQRIYSDDGNGDGRMTAVGMEVQYVCLAMSAGMGSPIDVELSSNSTVRSIVGPVSLFTAPTRKEMESIVEELFKSLEIRIHRPMWEDRDFAREFTVEAGERDSTGLLKGMMESLANLKQSREIILARKDAVVLALAIHCYKRSNNKWPTDMDQLSGNWFSETPIDRINGKPLHFTIKDGAPVVYSLGHDGDDDGGVNSNSDVPWMDRDSDGDWVLWPTNE